jgi:hypothetical protein
MVRVYASLDDMKHAVAWLEKAYEEHAPETPRVRLWGPVVRVLVREPEFERIAREMKIGTSAARLSK